MPLVPPDIVCTFKRDGAVGAAASGVAVVLPDGEGFTDLGDIVETATEAVPCQHAPFDFGPRIQSTAASQRPLCGVCTIRRRHDR